MAKKQKRFNRTSAIRHVKSTKMFKVSKNSRLEKYKSTDLTLIEQEIENKMLDILVAVAGTGNLEIFTINQLNLLKAKINKRIVKKQERENSGKVSTNI